MKPNFRSSDSTKLSAMLLCVVLNSGCEPSDGAVRRAVKGCVTLDGQPLRAATLTMHPIGQGQPVVSALVESGEFQFGTNDGPTEGTYQVRIEPPYPEFEQFTENPKLLPLPQRPAIARRFTEFGTLTAKVTELGIEPSVFEVKSQ